MDALLDILYSLHFHPMVFAIQAVLFTCFHFLMRGLIYNPLMKVREERDGRIHGGLHQAEQAAENARANRKKYEDEIKAHRHDLSVRLKKAIDEAEGSAAAVAQEARDQAGRVAEELNAKLDQEEKELRGGMDQQADKVALAVARQIVRNTLAEDAQGRVLARLGR